MNANEKQVAGSHYKDKAIQPWDFIISNNLGYLEGNIVKYVSRWKDKGGVADVKKAQHYLEKLLEEIIKQQLKDAHALSSNQSNFGNIPSTDFQGNLAEQVAKTPLSDVARYNSWGTPMGAVAAGQQLGSGLQLNLPHPPKCVNNE